MVSELEGTREHRRTFVGIPGSRQQPVASLLNCFASGFADYRVIMGVYGIGKTAVIAHAVDRLRALGLTAVFWPYSNYAALSIERIIEILKDHGGASSLRLGPRSRIAGAKDYATTIAWIKRRVTDVQKIGQQERLIIAVAVDSYDPTHEYISHSMLEGHEGTCCKVILEERVHREQPQWQAIPFLGRLVPVVAFLECEAKQFVREILEGEAEVDTSSAEVDRAAELLPEVICELGGRHPYLLGEICEWLVVIMKQSQGGWIRAEESDREVIRQRIRSSFALTAQEPLRGVLRRILDNLGEAVTSCLERIVETGSSHHEDDSAVAVLKAAGILSRKGACPEVIVWLLTGEWPPGGEAARALIDGDGGKSSDGVESGVLRSVSLDPGTLHIRAVVGRVLDALWESTTELATTEEHERGFAEARRLMEVAARVELEEVHGVLKQQRGSVEERLMKVVEMLSKGNVASRKRAEKEGQ